MKMLFLFAPLIVLCVAWLFGQAKLTRAFVTFFVWVLACQIIMIYPLFAMGEPKLGYFVLGFALLFLGAPVGALVGLTGRRDPAPVVVAAQAYDALDPDQKAKLHKGARILGRLAAKHVGNHLRDRGYTRTAEGIQEGARYI